jgi:hypothetical protein
MKLAEAQARIMESQAGYRVAFEWIEATGLRSDYFPERDEMPIPEEGDAWLMAIDFANATKGETCNLYVVYAGTFKPVPGYEAHRIMNR